MESSKTLCLIVFVVAFLITSSAGGPGEGLMGFNDLAKQGTAEGECVNASQTLWNMYKENASKVFDIDFVQYLRNGTELTVHSCSEEEESLNKLPETAAPVTELFLEGTAEGECVNASQTLWNMYKENAKKVFDIDFVRYLKDGILCSGNGSDPYFRYKFYSAQDAFYAKAAAVATYFMEFHETDPEIKHLLQARRVKDENYLQPLLSQIQDWRAAGWAEPTPVQAAIDYVSFDLGVAMNTSNVANVANAMASKAICVRLYNYIANTIARELKCRIYSHPYKEWIDNNVSPQLNDTYVSSTEKLLDLVASKLSATQCKQLQYYYREGLRHEFEFFKAVEKCPESQHGNYGKHKQCAQY